MDYSPERMLLKFTIISAGVGLLNLTKSQLIPLYKECALLAGSIGELGSQYLASKAAGDLTRQMLRYGEAIQHYQAALALTENMDFTHTLKVKAEAVCSDKIGICYREKKDYPLAIEYHEACHRIATQTGQRDLVGHASVNLGVCYERSKQFDKALNSFEAALQIADEIGNEAVKGKAHGYLGSSFCSRQEYDKALHHFGIALEIAERFNDKEHIGKGYANFGNVYYAQGRMDEATKNYEKYSKMAEEMGDKVSMQNARSCLGDCLSFIGNYREAITHYKASLDIAKQIGSKAREGEAHCDLGACYRCLSQYDKAIDHGKEAVRILVNTQDKKSLSIAYGRLGICFSCLGEYINAKKYHEKQLNIGNELSDTEVEAFASCNIGICLQSLGQYGNALAHFEKSLVIAKQMKHIHGESATYSNLGSCYLALGQCKTALEYYKLALDVSIKNRDKPGEGMAYVSIGNCCLRLGRYDDAESYFKMGLGIAKETGSKKDEGRAYGALGDCCHIRGEYEKAKDYHTMQLAVAQEIGVRLDEGGAHIGLSKCYQSLAIYDKAIYHLEASLDIYKELKSKPDEAQAYYSLGLLYISLDELEKAERYLQDCIQCYEDLFANAPSRDQLRISFLDTFTAAYTCLTLILLVNKGVVEALLMSERGRSRALAEILYSKYGTNDDVMRPNPQLTWEEVKELSSDSPTCILVLLTDFLDTMFAACVLEKSTQGFFFIHKDVTPFVHNVKGIKLQQTGKTHSATIGHVDSVISKTIDAAYEEIGVQEAVNCEDRSLDELDNYIHDATEEPSEEISDKLHELRLACSSATVPDVKSSYAVEEQGENSALEALYELIVDQLLKYIPTQDEMVVIPEGSFYRVPFCALRHPDTGQYLSDIKRIRLAPSLAILKLLNDCPQDQHSETGALIVGNPDVGDVMYQGGRKTVSRLPGTEEECKVIGDILGVQPLIGRQATKAEVMRRLHEDVAVVHIAAHGSDNRGLIVLAPDRSRVRGLPEEKDYMLTMADVQETGIRARLVVLSCCHSGRGVIRADGVIGISRAFLAAGARSVVASLWAIDDEATMFFMEAFYKNLRDEHSASTSLQMAMMTMRATDKWKAPRYWAPFFIIGDDVSINI